jgi:hypothetical protein
MSACYECNGAGYRHGCIDDYCRNSIEAEDCPNALLCRVCGGDGETFYDDNEDDTMKDGYE